MRSFIILTIILAIVVPSVAAQDAVLTPHEVDNRITGLTEQVSVSTLPDGSLLLPDDDSLYTPPEGYHGRLARGFEGKLYVIFTDAAGNDLPVVKSIIPTADAAGNTLINYTHQGVLLAQYNTITGVFMDMRAGLPLWPSTYLDFGEISGAVLGADNPEGMYFVYGYEVIDIGEYGYQIVPSHIAAEIHLFWEQTVPVILDNIPAYAALAEELAGTDPYRINEINWKRDRLEPRFAEWSFPNYLNTIIPPPASIETTVGRLRGMIEGGGFVEGGMEGVEGRVWQSADGKLLLLNIDPLKAFLAQYGENPSDEALIAHLLGGITADDTLTASQRFMLLSGIETPDTPIGINVNGDTLLTYAAYAYITLDHSSIWASLHYGVPQQMRAFLLHELGGHGPEMWGEMVSCHVYGEHINLRNAVEPVRYITELNDLLVLNPQPNPAPLREDYETTAAAVMFFLRFPNRAAAVSCLP